jgi:hypothetical protein
MSSGCARRALALTPPAENLGIASRLNELATLLDEQGANPHRARAYRRAAATIVALDRPASAILAEGGTEALEALPGIGPSIARSIRSVVVHGRLPMLERMRGEADPEALLSTVPGIGRVLAERVHDGLEIETLEQLEMAAHDGRLSALPGFGPKRVAAIREILGHRLAQVRTPLRAPPRDEPNVSELFDVDREYRDRAGRGELRTIAPRRFNPTGEAWLPVLHTQRGPRHYTALFSNTQRAHEMGRTRDWVILYYDGDAGERQCTVITAEWGPMRGRRIVRGREAECVEFHHRCDLSAIGL